MKSEPKALYRQWRPKTFNEVVGQDRIVENLKHQIQASHISHAYLFSGIRGTGKTTLAKIFARAVNCLDPKEGNPCNACEICKGILEESLMDVIEMDAASHNSVDDIRELKDHINYPPSKADFKVYIIDEVHMLSKGAFNALLKTLEEPPSHALFLLATTEPEKIPDTIRSRCQIYQFKRVSPPEIMYRLQTICEGVGVKVAETGLYHIVEKSEGSVRDAISSLDMLLSSGEKIIDEERVEEVLGLAPLHYYYEMTQAAYEGKEALLYEKLAVLYEEGKNIPSFLEGWLSFLRSLLLMGLDTPLKDLVIASAKEQDRMHTFQETLSRQYLLRLMEKLVDLQQQIRYASMERVLIETALMQICLPPEEKNIRALIERIERLEQGAVPNITPQKELFIDKKEEPVKDSQPSNEMEGEQKKDKIDTKAPRKAVGTGLDDQLWTALIDRIQREDSALYTLIMEAEPLDYSGGKLTLGFYDFARFQYNLMMAQVNQDAFIAIARSVLQDLERVESTLIKEKPKKKDLEADVRTYFSGFEDKLSIDE